MGVIVNAEIRRLSQADFGELAYAVMEHAFAIHAKMGRFFDEGIYSNALLDKLAVRARKNVRIEVTFDGFCKEYLIDLLVDDGGLFELKAVNKLTSAHRAQLINYLLLCELHHGKLINFRPTSVEHEFVNAGLRRADRIAFQVRKANWIETQRSNGFFSEWFEMMLRDLGVGLDIRLYEEAATHFLGGNEIVDQPVSVGSYGKQVMRIVEPGWALKITAMREDSFAAFEDHSDRLIQQTSLVGIHWINLTKATVDFRSMRRD